MDKENPLNAEMIEWKQHPFTERYFNFIRLCISSCKEDWAREEFTGNSLDQWALSNAKALGGLQVLRSLLKVETQDIIDAEKESREQIRN